MIDILFKGKRVDNEEWVYGYYVCLNGIKHLIYSGYAETDCGDYYPDSYEVSPETVEAVLPCKAGDTVYQVGTDCLIHEDKINKVIYSTDGVDFDERAIGKSVFLTREEAEAVLRELSEPLPEIENGR